ncbi:hypothetical protein [Massilia sp. Mn16-1_5]|uniref:hypothetical protein n=1 Tax=Massilia sp. Mn16-1_5 TaxID=2079199 RepID=UPI00109E4890|nr:hypothetical protein [Massilia sp. Mn16-1_5]THC42814.1 hypothetical protein C2862_14530 [Massilia sp. Mn16-1_5]
MSKFVRIDKENNPKKAQLLNLDLVASVELSPQSDLLSSADEKRVYLSCLAHDKTVIATVHFDTVEDAHAWVQKHLDVQL